MILIICYLYFFIFLIDILDRLVLFLFIIIIFNIDKFIYGMRIILYVRLGRLWVIDNGGCGFI